MRKYNVVMDNYAPPEAWQKSQRSIQQKDKEVTNVVKETFREVSKAPKKVVFKPIPVKPVEVKAEPEPTYLTGTENSAIESHEVLKDFFEIDDEVGWSEGEKLRDIWAYLSQKYPKAQYRERIHQLRQIEIKLGQPNIGQSRLGKIHNYIEAQKLFEDAQRWRDGVLGKKVQ